MLLTLELPALSLTNVTPELEAICPESRARSTTERRSGSALRSSPHAATFFPMGSIYVNTTYSGRSPGGLIANLGSPLTRGLFSARTARSNSSFFACRTRGAKETLVAPGYRSASESACANW